MIQFFYFGFRPSNLHPCKNPFQTNIMPDEILRTHPNFEANLPSQYTTPTTYKFESL